MLQLETITKSYQMRASTLAVLHGVSLEIAAGEFVAIMGASGSGKSTLLHIAGALDVPDSGDVFIQPRDGPRCALGLMSVTQRHRLRNRHIGFVFQFYHLLPELNVLENVLLPAMVKAPLVAALVRARPGKERALELLGQFGLLERRHHLPSELSGGERQRVAIARALINDPDLLLADEPTGNLDSVTGGRILDVLLDLHRNRGQTILMVTHDQSVAAKADRIVHLADGRIQ